MYGVKLRMGGPSRFRPSLFLVRYYLVFPG
jgi:hypothetical protein